MVTGKHDRWSTFLAAAGVGAVGFALAQVFVSFEHFGAPVTWVIGLLCGVIGWLVSERSQRTRDH